MSATEAAVVPAPGSVLRGKGPLTFVAEDKFTDVTRELLRRGWQQCSVASPLFDFKFLNYWAIRFDALRPHQLVNHFRGAIQLAHKSHLAAAGLVCMPTTFALHVPGAARLTCASPPVPAWRVAVLWLQLHLTMCACRLLASKPRPARGGWQRGSERRPRAAVEPLLRAVRGG